MEQVELTHRTSKGAYAFVNNHDTPGDIGRVLRRREVLGGLERHQPLEPGPTAVVCDPNGGERSVIAQDESDGITLKSFLATPRGAAADPAKAVCASGPLSMHTLTVTKGFEKMLRNYILRWTSSLDPDITSYDCFTDNDRAHVSIQGNTLYRHRTLKLRYTTYDMRDGEDKMYQRLHPDIMVLSDSNKHPYLYGRVLDIFHTNVGNSASNSILTSGNCTARLEMVWVRWFRVEGPGPDRQQGFHTLRCPSVTFCRAEEPDAFGLIHPDEIVRMVHLIPRFKLLRTDEYLAGPSAARPKGEEDDWRGFSVNMYVTTCIALFTPLILIRLADRDLFMRFRGGGIGHRYMRHIEPWLNATGWGTEWPILSDRDPNPGQSNTEHPAPASHGRTGGEEGGGEEDSEDSDDGEGEKGVQDGDGDDGSGEDSDLEIDEDGSSDEEDNDMDQLMGGDGSDLEEGGGNGIPDRGDSDGEGGL